MNEPERYEAQLRERAYAMPVAALTTTTIAMWRRYWDLDARLGPARQPPRTQLDTDRAVLWQAVNIYDDVLRRRTGEGIDTNHLERYPRP